MNLAPRVPASVSQRASDGQSVALHLGRLRRRRRPARCRPGARLCPPAATATV